MSLKQQELHQLWQKFGFIPLKASDECGTDANFDPDFDIDSDSEETESESESD